MNPLLLPLFLMAAIAPVAAQQVADTTFRPPIEKAAYRQGKGPVVLIDEFHNNFHTMSGRYAPFAEFLSRDGYAVKASAERFTEAALRAGRVLVIANAREALAADEIAAVRKWVAGGGSLLLIADHPPFEAPAAELGNALGVRFLDGVARPETGTGGRIVFRQSDGTLMDHPITKDIDEVATFTGTSFELEASGHPLLVFGPGVRSMKAQDDPDPIPLKGHLQGAVLPVGRGRVAVFGEAAMFSAQVSGPDRTPMGMNAPIARQNAQFLLNLMHWLTGLI